MVHLKFKYTLSSHNNRDNGYITIDGNEVHQIHNELEFYRSLGYADSFLDLGVLPEEFVWEEYRKDKGNKSPLCLQAKIIEFLLNNSLIFALHFSEQFGKCIGSCIDFSRHQKLKCTYCLLHPNQKEDSPYK